MERRGCVGIVRGAGRRGSVACGVAQCLHLGLLDLYLRFCILDAVLMYFYLLPVCVCAAVYGVIKNNNNNIIIVLFLN